MDIIQEMMKVFDKETERTVFSHLGSTKQKQTRGVNPIDGIYRMRDKMTTVILCNSDEQEELQAAANKENGFWKVIGVPYIEKGRAIIIKDEKLKMSILQGERTKNKK